MDELMVQPEDPPTPPTTPTPAPKRPRRFSRWLLLALVVSMALLGGAIFHELAARHDRRVAIERRNQAESRLADQQSDTKAAEERLAQAQSEARVPSGELAPPLASAQQLTHLADEELAVEQDMQRPQVANSVDAYNADVNRGNGIVAQYNAVNATFHQQLAKLPGSGVTTD